VIAMLRCPGFAAEPVNGTVLWNMFRKHRKQYHNHLLNLFLMMVQLPCCYRTGVY
jgi:hypothetical protein